MGMLDRSAGLVMTQLDKPDTCQAATLLTVKSKCMASYGNTTPLLPLSTTPQLMSAVTSVCTALTSRPTIEANSLNVSSPAPVIAFSSAIRFGDRVLYRSSQDRNVMKLPCFVLSPFSAAMVSRFTSSSDDTLIVTVVMLPPDLFDIVKKLRYQLLYAGECSRNFLIANVFMIPFTRFIIVAEQANTILYISHAVFVIVLTATNRRINLKNNNLHKRFAIEEDFCIAKRFRRHGVGTPSLFVVNDNNNTVRCQSRQHEDLISIQSVRYSDYAAAKSVAGFDTPNVSTAPDTRSSVFFVRGVQPYQSMVGWAGQPKGWPVTVEAGSVNPVQLTTHEFDTSGGDNLNHSTEGCPMATFLPVSVPQINIVEGKAVTSSIQNLTFSTNTGYSRSRGLKTSKSGYNQPRQCWIFYACNTPNNVGRATNTRPERGISPRLLLAVLSLPTPPSKVVFSKKLREVIMTTLPTIATPKVQIIAGKVVTTSIAVAEYFLKRHDNVIRSIENMDCSPEFRALNFEVTSTTVVQPNGGTRQIPVYQITRDGFTFLAMGFTGKRAARFKEAYIAEFNKMEATLRTPVVTPASPVTINCSPNRIPMHQMFSAGWCIQLNALLTALMNAEVQGQAVKVAGIYQAWAELESLCAELEKHMRRH